MTSSPLRPLIVLGTRPEAIKMAPLIRECLDRPSEFAPLICSTGQHREMLAQVLGYFQITPDIDLDLMRPGQTLTGLTADCLLAIDKTILEHRPDCLVVQGDTATVMSSAIVAFYHRLPIVHLEAGLRTGDLMAPWPEEFNRRVAGIVANLHCAPTVGAADALRREGVPEPNIRVTGNTVIDALLWTAERERAATNQWTSLYPFAAEGSMVLITGHRRENFGSGLENMCLALADLAVAFPETAFVYPVHLNPQVKGPVHQRLGHLPNMHLVPPADYPGFVWLMDRSQVILTDSGGVQEEAPSLGKPVLVTREKTERPEAVEAGLAELVGTDRERIVARVTHWLQQTDSADAGSQRSGTRAPSLSSPYGDGQAAGRIADWMLEAIQPTAR
ncbi:UDP-N-acetylglucosamine 2-epimerase [Roseimaritima multifibrata]|uniref:UDP-N-acetylglucosamine 2-epimerase (non-hydrolyzing) n=1 Tax=Roseimaritima multifibrata TaxID=1930274 RepID=A0A517MK91_9BACT|nr:UDP-N-acetylglucosamine 2-epimerase (non-hydrolyzing) [Roseimaritima multifibrata]QDS95306.1 UDP-N-acetylglucosamine 2-epimerase [Roseimaritima multifibrata]